MRAPHLTYRVAAASRQVSRGYVHPHLSFSEGAAPRTLQVGFRFHIHHVSDCRCSFCTESASARKLHRTHSMKRVTMTLTYTTPSTGLRHPSFGETCRKAMLGMRNLHSPFEIRCHTNPDLTRHSYYQPDN